MPENEAKRCFMRSLSYWSNKTLESNMSLSCHIRLLCCVVPLPWQSRNHARMPHCLQWGGMASLLGGLGDRFPQPNRYLPSKSPAACCGDLYFDAGRNQPVRRGPTGCELVERTMECREVKRVIEASVGECRDCAADGDRGVRRGAQRPHRLVVQLRHHAQLDGCGLHVPCADAQ